MCNYSGLNWDALSGHCPQGETPSEVATKIPTVVPLLLFLELLCGNISILCFDDPSQKSQESSRALPGT